MQKVSKWPQKFLFLVFVWNRKFISKQWGERFDASGAPAGKDCLSLSHGPLKETERS